MRKPNDLHASAKAFIAMLAHFEYNKESDPYWEVIFPFGKTQWKYLVVSEYKKVFYIREQIKCRERQILAKLKSILCSIWNRKVKGCLELKGKSD